MATHTRTPQVCRKGMGVVKLAVLAALCCNSALSFILSPVQQRSTFGSKCCYYAGGARPLSLRMSATQSVRADGATFVSQEELDRAERRLRSDYTAEDAEIMNSLFVRSANEQAPVPISGSESLPADLPGGALLRIGPNPRPDDPCSAFLDGDGMLHAIIIPPPEERARGSPLLYSRTWVRAAGFAKEEAQDGARGRTLFEGMMSAPRGWPVLRAMLLNYVRFGQAVKDTANTALSYHGGARPLLAAPPPRRPIPRRAAAAAAVFAPSGSCRRLSGPISDPSAPLRFGGTIA